MNKLRLFFVSYFLPTSNPYGISESLLTLFHLLGGGQVYATKDIVIVTIIFMKVNINDT